MTLGIKYCRWKAAASELVAALFCAILFTAVIVVAIEYALPDPPQQITQTIK